MECVLAKRYQVKKYKVECELSEVCQKQDLRYAMAALFGRGCVSCDESAFPCRPIAL